MDPALLIKWHIGSGLSICGWKMGQWVCGLEPQGKCSFFERDLTQHPVTASDPLSQRGRRKRPISSGPYTVLSFQSGLPPGHIYFYIWIFSCSRMHCLFHFTTRNRYGWGFIKSRYISNPLLLTFPFSCLQAASCTLYAFLKFYPSIYVISFHSQNQTTKAFWVSFVQLFTHKATMTHSGWN